eukprot:CAMPEP_0204873276 /NCGR_PEP_ID=MMETSP1348-20121228/40210_1 /ASSEMBLY_ACC=CAM_ASM_000700 /TAXON_ID=215587 /ORGANISM="Aplanochytrium stocchinoi, Strain GSBS06" /LENGTH=530 /DNA_ID=CAMNT_0052028531 /DNA_START=301 /DNA_END=1893 /DNA_ORIENTATION=-
MTGQIHKAYKVMLKLIDPRVIKDDQHIPLALMQKAKGIAFITVVKAGLIISGSAGTGIVITRLPNGQWSGPASVAVTGAGWGAQVGVTSTDSVIILNTDAAVKAFSGKGGVKLGGNLSVSVGPVGREADASVTKGSVKGKVAACYSYSHSRGLFAGASLEGTILYARPRVNRKFYGVDEVHPMQILTGQIKAPFHRDLHLLYETLRLVLDIASVEDVEGQDTQEDENEIHANEDVNVPETGNEKHQLQQIVSIPSLVGGNDEELTEEECLWFAELKTISVDSGLIKEGEFTSFEFVQYALICNGNVSQGINRMKKVVEYLDEMGLREMNIPDDWQKTAGELFIPAGKEKSGRTVLVMNAANFFPDNFKTKEQQKQLIKTFYELFRYAITTLADFRLGVTLIVDLEGAKKNNIPPSEIRRLLKRILKLALDGYPVILQRVILFNVKSQKTVASAINTMGKLFIPKAIRKLIEFRKLPGLLKIMDIDQVPEKLGGKYSESMIDWKNRQVKAYLNTCKRMDRYDNMMRMEHND